VYDLTLDRGLATAFVAAHGWDAFREALELMAGRPLGLYSVSGEWTWVPQIAVCKAKGAHGDLLVGLT
jgi:hypothetical protein